MANQSVAVIGAGFSGTLLSLHLLRHAPAGTRISLIERNPAFGPGLAYSTTNSSHRLNVPAGRMSAFDDSPKDFLDWLQRQPAQALEGVKPVEGAFVPRRLYGAYIQDLLKMASCQAGSTLELLHDSVDAADGAAEKIRLMLGSGDAVVANIAVLATGNACPEPPTLQQGSLNASRHWRPDPWSKDAFSGLDPNAAVVLIGTGLTMVDAVISLLDRGHAGPIHAVSRRGLLPCRHVAAGATSRHVPSSLPTDIRGLARLLRRQIGRAVDAGDDWRPVIDALRPFTRDLWQTLSLDDRKRFLRHLRPWWDVHRHRMPGSVADRIDNARMRGQLHITAGRIIGCSELGDLADVHYRPRGGENSVTLRVSRVVNCSGPATDYDRIADPLVRSLVRAGTVRPDSLRLGLDVTADGAVYNRNGVVSQSLFAIGPLTRGTFWEITAVPDIRRQCEAMALHLSGLLRVQAQTLSPRQDFLLYA